MKASTLLFFCSVFFLSFFVDAQGSLQWDMLDAGTTSNINDLFFLNPDTGYIVGDNYLFKKTTDGGLTWKGIPAPSLGERPGNDGKIVALDLHYSFDFSPLDSGLCLSLEQAYHGFYATDEGNSYSVFSYQDSNQIRFVSGFSILPYQRGNGYNSMYTFGQNCNRTAAYNNYHDGPLPSEFRTPFRFQLPEHLLL